jgi:hypothetical protein
MEAEAERAVAALGGGENGMGQKKSIWLQRRGRNI